ncbi:MAG: response regulator transcription factor [Dehalococcoidia bacterium]|nr:response regulator transcription factor [Dehalococcoidia bacterium]
MAEKIRVLIVDDHALLREGIRTLLGTCDDIEIVGEAADGREAVEKARLLAPEVVLMDIAMPEVDGIEATRRLLRENPQVKVLAMTQYDHGEYILSIVKAGAVGFIPKKAAAGELLNAIRAVHQGDSFLYPSIARTVIDDYLRRARDLPSRDPYEGLPARQKELLRLVADGSTVPQVADSLGMSAKTARSYLNNVMKRLAIHNRAELVKYAIRKGLVSLKQ